MSNRDRFGPELGPPPTERDYVLALLVLIVIVWLMAMWGGA